MCVQVEEAVGQQAPRISAAIEAKVAELISSGVAQRAGEVDAKVARCHASLLFEHACFEMSLHRYCDACLHGRCY